MFCLCLSSNTKESVVDVKTITRVLHTEELIDLKSNISVEFKVINLNIKNKNLIDNENERKFYFNLKAYGIALIRNYLGIL